MNSTKKNITGEAAFGHEGTAPHYAEKPFNASSGPGRLRWRP